MQIELNKLPKSTYEATVIVSPGTRDQARQEVLKHLAQEAEVKGFRKGKAPVDVVEKNTNPDVIKKRLINTLATQAAMRVIKEHHLNPILPPKASFEKESEEGVTLKLTIVERPEVKLGNYRTKLKEALKEQAGKSQIKTAASLAEAEQNAKGGAEEQPAALPIEIVLKVLKETCSVEIPEPLIEQGVNTRLSQLVNRMDKVGLSIEQYLESQGTTVEKMREDYRQQSEQTLQMEFVLQEISKQEKVTVTDEDIQAAIDAAPDEKSKQEFAKPEKREYIRNVLVRSKTVEKLAKAEFVDG